MKSTTQAHSGRTTAPGVLGLLLVVGLASVAGTANAQWVVSDPGHTALTYAGWIEELIAQGQQYAKQIAQYQTQVQQYETQVRQFEQQYVKGGVFNQKAMSTREFTPRALDAGMEQRCPDGLRSLLSSSSSSENCAMIVQTENARYNAIVSVLTLSKERDKELQKIYAERAGISQEDAGALQANNNSLLSLQSRMQMDVQQARSQTEGYDRLLELLREDQRMIANGTLEGGGIAGGVIRGAALRAALRNAKREKR
jgi:hypothetical protein